MANPDKPNGFRPLRYLNGAPYNGAVNKYVFPAADGTAAFVGDLVTMTGVGDATTGLNTITQAVASTDGSAVIGVLVGLEVDPTNLNTPQYRTASTRRIAYVVDDPNVLLTAQEDGDTDPLETADIGLNVNFVVGTGSTVTGASAFEIDSTTHSTVAAFPLKLMGLVQAVDNNNVLATGGETGTRWVLKINNHQLAGGTGTIGV
jgi:hypothetical protein